MKIAFIVSDFPRLSETFILNQITGLLDLGHDVQIFARVRSPETTIHPDVEKYRLMQRLHCLTPEPRNKFLRMIKAAALITTTLHTQPVQVYRALNALKYGKDAISLDRLYLLHTFFNTQFDILHCHFGYNGNIGAHVKSLGLPGKLITAFHGHDIRLALEQGENIYAHLFRQGDCFLSPSDYIQKMLISFDVSPDKIIRHPIGIDLQKFTYTTRPAPLPSTPIVIMTIARLSEVKGLAYGIHAIAECVRQPLTRPLEYRIIGGGELEDALKELTRDLNLADIVRFLGPMDQDGVIQQLQDAHIFMLPSIQEAFGVVLLEAQATGLPVIATDVGGVSEALIPGKTGFLVSPQNIGALAEQLLYLIQHPEIWPVMGRVGREFVREHFDIHALNRKLVQIYTQVLSDHPR